MDHLGKFRSLEKGKGGHSQKKRSFQGKADTKDVSVKFRGNEFWELCGVLFGLGGWKGGR